MEEVSACLRMLDEVYAVFGLTYKAALSSRPEGYLGTLEQWDRAEAALKDALDATGKAWEVCAKGTANSLMYGHLPKGLQHDVNIGRVTRDYCLQQRAGCMHCESRTHHLVGACAAERGGRRILRAKDRHHRL